MTEDEEKAAFAALLIKSPDKGPDGAFKIALGLFGSDTAKALKVSYQWPTDPVVQAEITRLKSTGEDLQLLPSKTELAQDIWNKMQVVYVNAEDYVKLAKLYAEVMVMIQKQAPAPTANIVVANKVMVVKDYGTNDQWEAAAERQQRALTNGEFTNH